MAILELKTAEELTDPALEARWTARRAARETAVLQRILRTFVDRGGSGQRRRGRLPRSPG